MTRTFALNLFFAAVALFCSAALAISGEERPTDALAPPTLAASTEVTSEGGRKGLRDAGGRFVPLARYSRIVSTSGVTDSLLYALCEPDRIVAVTRFSAESPAHGYRFSGKTLLRDIADVEAIVGLRPDLVLVNSVGGAERIARLRDAGLEVFDLGEMRGLATLLPNLVTVGHLVGRAEAGRVLARSFERRMRAIASELPESERKTGLYLTIYGDSIYGGVQGTSYHDVLRSAGLLDASQGRFRDWPRYTAETLLSLDPDVVVTHAGMKRLLCAHTGMEQLRACGPEGQVAEIGDDLLDDPSMTMLEAAEAVYEAVYVKRGSSKSR